MSADIKGMVFFEQQLKDGKIKPYLGDEHLQEEAGELLDDASQFTTETIINPEDHDIYENLANQPTYEEPPEEISERCQDSVFFLRHSWWRSPKHFFHDHKWDCHHTPSQNVKSLPSIKADQFTTVLYPEKVRLHLTFH